MWLCQCCVYYTRIVCFRIMSMFTLVYKVNSMVLKQHALVSHNTHTHPYIGTGKNHCVDKTHCMECCVWSVQTVNYSGLEYKKKEWKPPTTSRLHPNRMNAIITTIHAILFPRFSHGNSKASSKVSISHISTTIKTSKNILLRKFLALHQ